jgi:hypothetical protein
LEDIVLEEAVRLVKIRENDQISELPAFQAATRNMTIASVKGDHKSQVTLSKMVRQIAVKRAEDRARAFLTAMEYKDDCQKVFKRCNAQRAPRPDFVPHPDDMVLDYETKEVIFDGPVTDEQKAEWDAARAERPALLEIIAHCRRQLDDPLADRAILEGVIAKAQDRVDILDGVYPDERTRRLPGFDIKEWRRVKKVGEKIERQLAAALRTDAA